MEKQTPASPLTPGHVLMAWNEGQNPLHHLNSSLFTCHAHTVEFT